MIKVGEEWEWGVGKRPEETLFDRYRFSFLSTEAHAESTNVKYLGFVFQVYIDAVMIQWYNFNACLYYNTRREREKPTLDSSRISSLDITERHGHISYSS
jgi:hypothetical protein